MANTIKLIVYPVKDVETAQTFYNTFLGVEPYVVSPYYVGYKVDGLEIGLDPNSSVGPLAYTSVDDIHASLEAMTRVGAEIVQAAKNVGNGLWIAQVKDTQGNVVGLRQQS